MSLERPLALALLFVPAVLLWLRLRAARPRAEEASSLLVWQKVSPADTVPVRPRPPLAAWIEALGAALLVVGMAGPLGPAGPAPATVRVILDSSPSMNARRPDGRSRIDAARAVLRERQTEFAMEVVESRDPALEAVGIEGGPPLVLVTDHRDAKSPRGHQRMRSVGLGDRGFNAGITGVSGEPLLDGSWRLLVTIEAHGGAGPVEGTVRVVGTEVPVTLTQGIRQEFVHVVPGADGVVSVSFPNDILAADDTVVLSPFGGAPVAFDRDPDSRLDPLVRALRAAGAEEGNTRPGPPGLRLHRTGRDRDDLLPQGLVEIEIPAGVKGEPVAGAGVVASDDPWAREVRIDPSVTLGLRGGDAPPGTRAVLSDGKGPLAWREDRPGGFLLRFGFVPGGTWTERDPSFVVLARNLVEEAALGPRRIATDGVCDSRETREAAEGESFGDLAAAIEEATLPDPASRASYAFALILLGAWALGAAWLAMR